jgi:TrmH family RNA methyltransferase
MTQSLTRADERLFIALRQRDQRQERGLFLAEGVRLVEELVASQIPIEIAAVAPALEDTERGHLLAAALAARTRVRNVSAATLQRIAATEAPQGVVAIGQIPVARFDDIPVTGNATGLVLDAIQDPGNFGTLVRSADAFGAAFVLALDGTVDPWNPKSVRATAGSAFRVPIFQSGTAEAIGQLRRQKVRLLVADSGGAAPGARGEGPIALAIGNEGAGVRPELRQAADGVIAIPVRGAVESLNAAVAGSILLYLLTR